MAAPTRSLRDRPDLDQLKRQAKELLRAFVAGDPAAVAEVTAHYHGATAASFALHDAQLVIARAYGFDSWPKLKGYVDGVTIGRLIDAVRAGDLATVTSMITARPELIHMDRAEDDEHQALHHAVLSRQPAIVRVLMQHGADARKGIWPHRDATSPLTLASERGDGEIVAIIREEEQRRSNAPTAPLAALDEQELRRAFQRGDEDSLIRAFDSQRALIQVSDASDGMTALHYAAACLWERFAIWLLDHEANVSARTSAGLTPLDVIGSADSDVDDRAGRLLRIGELLVRHGAERTIRRLIATGDVAAIRARVNEPGTDRRGLVTFAVTCGQPDSLAALLEAGLDPDERHRIDGVEEVVWSWGEPLLEAVRAGHLQMASVLLEHGANPNTGVYAASSAMQDAWLRQDREMVNLLERHGGFFNATAAGYLGLADRVRQLFEAERAGRLPEGAVGRTRVSEDVLESATDAAHIELVQMALDDLDWPPGDPRWQGMLMRPFGGHHDWDRDRYLTCFRLILDRSGVNLPGRFGRTLLHDVAANWPRSSPMRAADRVAFATMLLDRGASLTARDELLKSTPLGWACRWGRLELVRLFLARGADPTEADAEPWATPRAWAERNNNREVVEALSVRRPEL